MYTQWRVLVLLVLTVDLRRQLRDTASSRSAVNPFDTHLGANIDSPTN